MRSHDVKLMACVALCWPQRGISVTMPQTLKGHRGTQAFIYRQAVNIEAKEGHQYVPGATGEGFLTAVSRRTACASQAGARWCAREQQRAPEVQLPPSRQRRKTICSLHGLRGVALLAVCMSQELVQGIPASLPRPLWASGQRAVLTSDAQARSRVEMLSKHS